MTGTVTNTIGSEDSARNRKLAMRMRRARPKDAAMPRTTPTLANLSAEHEMCLKSQAAR